MSPFVAEELGVEINGLLGRFKALKNRAENGERPVREASLCYRASVEGWDVAIECNPNVFPDPFKAEMFIKASCGEMGVSGAVLLPGVVEAVKAYKNASN